MRPLRSYVLSALFAKHTDSAFAVFGVSCSGAFCRVGRTFPHFFFCLFAMRSRGEFLALFVLLFGPVIDSLK